MVVGLLRPPTETPVRWAAAGTDDENPITTRCQPNPLDGTIRDFVIYQLPKKQGTSCGKKVEKEKMEGHGAHDTGDWEKIL